MKMPFLNFALFLPSKVVENPTKMFLKLPKEYLLAIFWYPDYVALAFPFCVTLSGTRAWRLLHYSGTVKLLLSPGKAGGLPKRNYLKLPKTRGIAKDQIRQELVGQKKAASLWRRLFIYSLSYKYADNSRIKT